MSAIISLFFRLGRIYGSMINIQRFSYMVDDYFSNSNMQYPKDTIDATFHMLSPMDRAIMRNTPETSHMFIKYGIEYDKALFDLLSEKKRVCSVPKIEELIQKDDTQAITLLMNAIDYVGSDSAIIPWLHFTSVTNFCMKYDAIDIFTELFNFPYYRMIMKDTIEIRKIAAIRGHFYLFSELKVPSKIFSLIFGPDSWILDTIKQQKNGLTDAYESILHQALLRRDYDTITGLCEYDPDAAKLIEKIEEKPRGKPEKRFLKCSRILYKCSEFLHGVRNISLTKDLLDKTPLMDVPFSIAHSTLLSISQSYDLHDEVCALMCTIYGEDIDGELYEKLDCNSSIFPHKSENIFISTISVCFNSKDISALRKAIKEDEPSVLLDLITTVEEERIRYVIEEIFPLILFDKSDFCLRALLNNEHTEKHIKDIATDGFYVQHSAVDYYGWGINGLTKGHHCELENSIFSFLLLLAKDISCFSTLYDHRYRMSSITPGNIDEFRYMLALGSIIHLNTDLYAWVIDELYDGDEESFMINLYLRSQLIRDKYADGEHLMLGVFRAFKLYQQCENLLYEPI